jgi:hypothetical protein
MGLGPVDQLGSKLERCWRDPELAPHRFSEIALSELGEADLPGRIAPEDIIDWAFAQEKLPQQENLPATFGQPPVTLFRSPRFYIESLFWVDATTSIHQHGFSGAFQVLRGSSIETRYSFESGKVAERHFALGTLAVAATSLLRQGDVRPIVSGRSGLIHALFHLDRPSVSLVVRTFRDPDAGPQLSYLRPGVAHDPFLKDETLDRTVELVKLLRRIEHPSFEEKVGALIAGSGLHRAYRVLSECAALPDRALFERLLGRVSDQAVAALFRAAFEESRRLGFLVSRRALVKDTDLRFFLGVLLNAHRRKDVLSLVGARTPGRDAAATVASWVRQLSTTSLKLQAAGVPWQPNILALPDMDDQLERALEDTLAGREVAGAAEARFVAALRELPALAALFG